MKIKPKEVKAKVNLLVDPNPVRMSFVDAGANQTPWNSLKREKVGRKTTGARTMKSKAGKGSKRVGFLTKMQFSKAQFATKADVKKYLDEQEIEGYGSIKDGDDVWIVPTTEEAPQEGIGKAASVPGKEAGVTVFIAPVNKADADDDEDEEDGETDENSDDADDNSDDDGETDDDAEDEEEGDGEDDDDADTKPKARKGASKAKIIDSKPIKKGVKRRPAAKKSDPVLDLPEELVAKFDWWGAYVSGDTTLSGVLHDGSYDNIPPGLETVLMAVGFTIGNILGDDGMSDDEKLAALKQAGEEQAEFAFGLFTLFKKATKDEVSSASKATRAGAAKFVETFSASVDAIKALKISDNVSEDDDDDADEEETKPKAKKGEKKPAAKADDDGTTKILKAVAGLSTRMDRMDEELSRSTTSKSMSDSIEDLIDEDDDDAEETEQLEARKREMRRSFGLKV